MDIAWSDQYTNPDITFAARSSGSSENSQDEYSALTWGAGESRLNFHQGAGYMGRQVVCLLEFDFR
jgi:hypothetical protein